MGGGPIASPTFVGRAIPIPIEGEMLIEVRWCKKCGIRNRIVGEICCYCGWHNGEDRKGTNAEIKEATGRLDRAISRLQTAIFFGTQDDDLDDDTIPDPWEP